ncbi:hypothetical protein [uncultured Sphingomonas sp.]|uniref:hypothetical protein n=1 Tax=uncultured Sphingomonas sp. TaxID=158754 RepID=UPI0025CDFB9C|nr:hypothetical protein [uncultured Sphingomonas sp.]
MSDPARFDEDDWAALSSNDKKTLRIWSRVALDFEPLARATGVGQKSMDSLISKDLAVEGEGSLHGRTFKLTDKGWLAVEWLHGRKMREYPAG